MTVLRASKPSFLIVFLTTLILCANAAPVEYQMVGFGPSPDHARNTREAQRHASLMIDRTSHLLNKHPHHPKVKGALVESFGEKHNLNKIRKNFNTLKSSGKPVKVTDADHFRQHPYDASTVITPQHGANPSKAHAAVHSDFHSLSDNSRAAEMVKFASQVVCSTKDHFKVEGSGQSCKTTLIGFQEHKEREKKGLPTLSGKHGSKDLSQLKQSDQMHMNADSYGKLAKAVDNIIPGSRPGSPYYDLGGPSRLINKVPHGSPPGSHPTHKMMNEISPAGGRRLGSPGPSRLNGNTRDSHSPTMQPATLPGISDLLKYAPPGSRPNVKIPHPKPGSSSSGPKYPRPPPLRIPSRPLAHPNVQHRPAHAFRAAAASVPQHPPPAQHHASGSTAPVQTRMHTAHPHSGGSGYNSLLKSTQQSSKGKGVNKPKPWVFKEESGTDMGKKRPRGGGPSNQGPPPKQAKH